MVNRPAHLFLSESGSLHDTREFAWPARPLRDNFARHTREIKSVADLKSNLRAGEFTFPGAYRLAFLADDGGAVCFDCARANFAGIVHSIRHDIRDGWKLCATFTADYCEGESRCDHCNATLREAESE